MQAVRAPGRKTTAPVYTKQESENFCYFSLQGVLPPDHILILNRKLGTLSYLSTGSDGPRLLVEQQFTGSELSLLLPLLEQYPHYCPYELMFASFYNGIVTDALVEDHRRRLQEALEVGTWDQQMRPIRNVLSRIRFKLRTFGLDISSILETGYILMVASKNPSVSAPMP